MTFTLTFHAGFMCIYNCYFFLNWSLDQSNNDAVSYFISYYSLYLKSILSKYYYTFVSIYMEYFISSVSVCVSLDLRWMSCRKHVYESYFYIHSATQCLWIWAVSPFTFKLIISMYVLTAILFIVLDLGGGIFFPLFLHWFSSLVSLWLFLMLCLDSFFFVFWCIC